MRCKDCSEVRGYPYKRSHLVALRVGKITASDPPSTWWPRMTVKGDKHGVAIESIYGIKKMPLGSNATSETGDLKDHGVITGYFATTS